MGWAGLESSTTRGRAAVDLHHNQTDPRRGELLVGVVRWGSQVGVVEGVPQFGGHASQHARADLSYPIHLFIGQGPTCAAEIVDLNDDWVTQARAFPPEDSPHIAESESAARLTATLPPSLHSDPFPPTRPSPPATRLSPSVSPIPPPLAYPPLSPPPCSPLRPPLHLPNTLSITVLPPPDARAR